MKVDSIKAGAGLAVAVAALVGASMAHPGPPVSHTNTPSAPQTQAVVTVSTTTLTPTPTPPVSEPKPHATTPAPVYPTSNTTQRASRYTPAAAPNYTAGKPQGPLDYRPGANPLPEPLPEDSSRAQAERAYQRCVQGANGNTGRWTRTECDRIYGPAATGEGPPNQLGSPTPTNDSGGLLGLP